MQKSAALAASCAVGVVAGGAAAFVFAFAPPISWTIGITACTASLWLLEAVPLPVSALVPLVALPSSGVLPYESTIETVGTPAIVLLMGTFMLSAAVERSGVHERLVRYLLRACGSSAKGLVLGFMLSAALLSMCVSNTATALVMLPIAVAVLDRVEDERVATSVLLGIAYAASIGGMGTLAGTPPNLIFAGMYAEATGADYGFQRWFVTGALAVALGLPCAVLWLTRGLTGHVAITLPSCGGWRPAERRVVILFALTILAWATRTAPFGGWSSALGLDQVGDATIVLAAVLVSFLVPDGRGSTLLDWPTAVQIPWGLLLLFAGGIAIARAFEATGLSAQLGSGLVSLSHWPIAVLTLALVLGVSFATELTSSTATTTLLLPIVAVAATAGGFAPETLMVPATLAASCSFMFPVSTAPNAIVTSTGRLRVATMAREGVVLNVLLAIAIAVACRLTLP